MARNELPASVQHLIRQHFDSAVDVETLLLLQRDHRAWSPRAVARELRIHADQAHDVLIRLRRTGLLRLTDGTFQYDPTDPVLAGAAMALAELYPTYRLAVVSLIYES